MKSSTILAGKGRLSLRISFAFGPGEGILASGA